MQTRKRVVERKFLGKLVGPWADKYERNFEKRHLKAYIRGEEYFPYGYKEETLPNGAKMRVQAWHQTLQTLVEKDA